MKAQLTKKLVIANDHAGLQLKRSLMNNNKNIEWKDMGVFNENISDYTEQATILCRYILEQKTATKENIFGVLICGSGQGMAMKANRFPHIRAALAWSEKNIALAREHNNANVLCLGARLLSVAVANNILNTFISTPFKGGRHTERVYNLERT